MYMALGMNFNSVEEANEKLAQIDTCRLLYLGQ